MTSNVASRSEHVVGVAAVGRDDVATAGGKGANLGELVRAGFAVPAGFVIATGAYASVVEAGGLAPRITEGLASDESGASIRAAFETVTVPGELRAQIVKAYTALGGGPVAVRSSATAEDLPGAAFAGQQDTYLNVVGEDAVVDAVRRCWGSLWTERAIAYRRRQGIDPAEVRIAVVVQRMVEAEFAGVMFTANPVTGARSEVVVDASCGLGEAVVSGLVTPDHYVLDEHGTIRERVPGRREVVIRGAAGGGTTHGVSVGDPAADAVLPDVALSELATLGRSVAAHFGRPQDIEWAYADGTFWLVQSRPMTALPPPPLSLSRLQRAYGVQLMDYLTVRPYPLDVSAWIRPGVGRMVTRMLAEIPGLHVDIAEMLPESDGVVDRFVPTVPRPTLKILSAPARILPRLRRYDPAHWTDDRRFIRFRTAVEELAGRDLRTLGWAELLRVPRRAWEAMDLITDLRVDYLPRVGLDLLRLRMLLKVLGLVELFPLLIVGGHTRTEDTNRALQALAQRVRDDEGLRAAFGELDPPALLERIEHEARFADFAVALRAFLDEYGHRETTSPLLMSAPTWGDAPETVFALVMLLAEPPSADTDPAVPALRRLLEHRLVALTGSGAAVRRVVNAARAGIACREDTHFYATAVLPALRQAALESGRRLVAAGVLRDPEEVMHLRLEELEGIEDPGALSRTGADRLRALVRTRSAARSERAGVPLIAAAALIPPAEADTDALVSGIGASGGRVAGAVRVIRGPEGFATLRAGEVLVCPYTNPAWTPLFQRAAAVVVDSGGLGSHAAIVAREYGIPAVMGTARGTAVLADGQLVVVDGDTGRVTTSY